MERIILVYPKDKAGEVCALLGIEKIDKVVYSLAELQGETEQKTEEK